jgi:large subunit ribosomal protein L31e
MSDQEIELERVYTVPLSRAWITARHRRTRRAVNILREFAEHHMKSSEIKIDTELNEALWKRGITKPPRRIIVKMEKDEDGVVTISLPKETKRKSEVMTPKPSEKKEEESPPVEKSAPAAEPAAIAPVAVASPAATTEEKPKKAPTPKKPAAKPPAKKKSAKKAE